ncbi:MAG: ammonium transporter [Sulfurospirillaceae bacterium]|jgi:Amt family ammonium transporter|nr:ammonium transporter [Sulfurospirillaceae bacterium]MDD2825756.1 ammonium transporter [Sulfurospirillaceae bacterium]
MRNKLLALATLLPVSIFAAEEAAAEAAEKVLTLDVGNTAWVLTATALVMLMTPAGLALFYGGMSRSKNLLNTIAMSVMGYIVASIVWVIAGYTLAFGTDINGVIGFDSLFMSGIKVTDIWATGNIPVLLFAAFQMTFAGITVALASGAIIERLKFSTWMIFAAIWVLVVYAPIAHWVWGGGFLSTLGVLDFAGGTVVHINAGVAGLVMCLMLGKRADFGKAMFPSSVTLTVLGASLLWFGWFGFNAGSELGADGIAASAFLVTNTAAAIAALAWMLVEYVTYKKFTLLGIASGIVAGLVAITPAAGFVDTSAALIIGAIAGIVAFYGVNGLKKALKYDDSLDAFGIHGIAGIWGALATGIFANPEVNELGKGLLYGNPDQVLIQVEGIVVTIVYTAIATAIVFKIASILTAGARVEADEESQGLDEVAHGEKSFNIR